MADPFKKLYDDLAARKGEASATSPYEGGNGRIDRAVKLIRGGGFPTSGTLVDVGGATGNLGYALRDLFSKKVVIDIAEACRFPAESKGNEFHRVNVDAEGLIGFVDASVDLVVALDFIEHILDPGGFAEECHRVLRRGGAVLINTPNIQYWRHLESLVIHGLFPHTSGDQEVYHGGHVAFYNLRDMRAIFEGAGFVDPRMHTDGLPMDAPPNLWISVSNVPAMQMAVADLVFSCRKS